MTKHVDVGSGYLGKNRYQKSETQPPYTGKLKVNGTEYRLAAWIRKGDDGEKYFSVKVSAPEDNRSQGERMAENAGRYAHNREDFDDDIPF